MSQESTYYTWFKHLIGAVGTFVLRFGYLPFNYNPLGAYGFVSKNIILFFASIITFDIVKSGFYTGFYWTYLGFACYPLFGYLAGKRWQKFAMLPLASLGFFALSNFGSFLGYYELSVAGFVECYTAALPFFKNTFIADIGFGYLSLAICALEPSKWLFSNLVPTSRTVNKT